MNLLPRLTIDETEKLFELIALLKDEGLGIIYISHHLEEIFEICDRVTVLRDGKLIKNAAIADVDEDLLISWMVGRDISEMYHIQRGKQDAVVLEANGITNEPFFEDLNFKLHKGEVLGFFGLVGSGRTEVLRTMFGAERLDAGEIIVKGEPVFLKGHIRRWNMGLGLSQRRGRRRGWHFRFL